MTPVSKTRYIIEHATAYYKLIGITSFRINSTFNKGLKLNPHFNTPKSFVPNNLMNDVLDV